ncbi:MAG: ClpP family protease [Planctomycetota bacterium]|jgi:ATP-dependent Clp protease protease subunit
MPEDPRQCEKEKDDKEPEGLMKRMLKARTILVSDVITDKLARQLTSQVLLMQEDDREKPITVYVNSPGGSADSGFAMFDILRFVKPPVRTIVTGLCASAAVMVYLAPKKNARYALPNSRFLLHQPSTMVLGSASDIAITAEEIVKLKKRYNEIVAEETGKTEDVVSRDADRDFWLTAEEAKEYGLVGNVIASHGDLK